MVKTFYRIFRNNVSEIPVKLFRVKPSEPGSFIVLQVFQRVCALCHLCWFQPTRPIKLFRVEKSDLTLGHLNLRHWICKLIEKRFPLPVKFLLDLLPSHQSHQSRMNMFFSLICFFEIKEIFSILVRGYNARNLGQNGGRACALSR